MTSFIVKLRGTPIVNYVLRIGRNGNATLVQGEKILDDERNQNQTIIFYNLVREGFKSRSADHSKFQIPNICTISKKTLTRPLKIVMNAKYILTIDIKRELSYMQYKIIDGNCITDSNIRLLPGITITDVACGINHTVVAGKPIRGCGLFVSGINNYGQLGLDEEIRSHDGFAELVLPEKTMPFTQVTCGPHTTFALCENCIVYACGLNNCGQLGIDTSEKPLFELSKVKSLEPYPVVQIAAGLFHTLALTSTGAVLVAGSNKRGQLGMGSSDSVSQFTVLDALSNLFIIKIAASHNTSAAIDEFGTLFVWGDKFGPKPVRFFKDEDNAPAVRDVVMGHNDSLLAVARDGAFYFLASDSGGVRPQICRAECSKMGFGAVFSAGSTFAGVLMPAREALEFNPSTGLATLSTFEVASNPKARELPVSVMTSSAARQLASFDIDSAIKIAFSSMAAVNGCCVSGGVCEGQLSDDPGIDFEALSTMFEILKRRGALDSLMKALSSLFATAPPIPANARPSAYRFLLIALCFPVGNLNTANYWGLLSSAMIELNISSAKRLETILTMWIAALPKQTIAGIVETVERVIDASVARSGVYYTTSAQSIVWLMNLLFTAAMRSRALTFQDFYNSGLSHAMNHAEENNRYRSGSWCYCKNAPFLLDAECKTNFMRVKAKELMNSSASTYGFSLSNFLILKVERNNIIESTRAAISKLSNPKLELKKPLRVQFIGEPAIDAGGVQREYFEILVKALFDKKARIFREMREYYWFLPNSHKESTYELVGTIFGIAIYNSNILNVRFPPALYKQLRGIAVDIKDLEEFDPELVHGLNELLSYEGDVENDLCVTFMHEDKPIIENGETIPVTNSNRRYYVDTLVKYILTDSIQPELDAFKKGFLKSAGHVTLELFRPEELGLLIAGREDLDFHALESATIYQNGFSSQSQAVRIFWKIVHNTLTDEEKKKLLYFITSSPRAPVGGLGSLRMQIERDSDPRHIPSAHTCFNQLVLPDIRDEGMMLKKLRIALENNEGFQFR